MKVPLYPSSPWRMALRLSACLLVAVPGIADACRCAQRSLAEYFSVATVVTIARVVDNTTVEGKHQRVLDLDTITTFKGSGAELTQLTTGLSSAACGIDVPPGTVLLVFANVDPSLPDAWMGNTCNGTRPLDEARGEGSFRDVDAADVRARLTELSQAQTDVPTSDNATRILPEAQAGLGVPRHNSIIGLATIPALQREGQGQQTGSVPAYAESTARCGRRMLTSIDNIATREADYEHAAAIVHEIRDGRYRIALTKAASGVDAWVPRESIGQYWPLGDLLAHRLTYLTADWDGKIWPFAGAGRPRMPGRTDDEPVVEVTGSWTIGDSLWLEIRLLDSNPCAGGEPKVSGRGWIPAWNEAGRLSVWFWSRGC